MTIAPRRPFTSAALRDRLNAGVRRVPVRFVYLLGALPPFWYLYLAATGQLGVEPVEALEHRLGELGLWFLIAGLAVTPLRRFARINLMPLRRAIGVLTFYYIACHLLVWAALDVQTLGAMWADIAKRPYITVGMAAFLLLTPLALTSNNRAVRWLGPRWRLLHRLVYPAAILGALHYVLLAKGFRIEPLLYLGTILLLLALRAIPARVGRTI